MKSNPNVFDIIIGNIIHSAELFAQGISYLFIFGILLLDAVFNKGKQKKNWSGKK